MSHWLRKTVVALRPPGATVFAEGGNSTKLLTGTK